MKPATIRDIEWIAIKKANVEMAISLLSLADSRMCSDKVRKAIDLLQEEIDSFEEQMQDIMEAEE